jgi:hypothetical protein
MGLFENQQLKQNQSNFQRNQMLSISKLPLISSLVVVMAVPALAGVTVNSPYNNAQVGSPFTLSADASTCSSKTVTAMGYSLDSSSETTIVDKTSIELSVQASAGSHTLHVKAWGEGGVSCVTDVAVTVTGSVATVPSDTASVSSIQTMGNWKDSNDSGVGGGVASGSMSLVNSPSRSGNARKFVSTSSNYGGERYDVSFGDDTDSLNFLYDAWVYLPGPSNNIANLEMDMNQTMANGQTVIFGFQCDGWNGTWDYTENAGSPSKPVDKWIKSKQGCNPHSWATNTWHHVQVSYSRTTSGEVTYKSVTLDGNLQEINATVNSAFALHWGPTLLTNLQVDGATSGKSTSTVYLDELTISRW